MTQYIKAPFNFVPLNEKVFFPKWANEVTHDIPFSDGESGEIELELEAMTPIFVRNGHTKADAEAKNENYVSFSKDADGNYFIPGTSVKGMIRNVLEIMSFGKMKVDEDMKFAQREWNNKEVYPIMKPEIQNSLLCGWLEINENGDSTIHSCGQPMRINHLRIDEFFRIKKMNISFKNEFSTHEGNDLGKERAIGNTKYDPKEASYKYALIQNRLNILENLSFETDEKYNKELNRGSSKAFCERRVKVTQGEGEFKGTIVFTGQPDTWVNPEKRERKMRDGKFYEFVFPKLNGVDFPVSQKTIKEFKFIYKDSPSWTLFKNKNRIPVFFRLSNDGIKVIDFGLALLYRLPYKNSVHDLLLKNQKIEKENEGKPDLIECIFGFTQPKSSLKSRVQFSHFKAEKNVIPGELQYTTLGSPKASYFPIYIEQFGTNGVAQKLVTYESEKAVLSGRKRYPVKRIAIPRPTENKNLDTPFIPLPSKTLFKGKIRFHNLKPAEIGALLSAITFHGNQEKLFHNIGMGKPLGYGKLKAVVKVKTNEKLIDIDNYLCAFENEMDTFCKEKLKRNWHSHEIITELFTMADDVEEKQERLFLDYMRLDIDNKINDFVSAKGLNEYLQRFTEVTKKEFLCQSVCAEVKKEKKRIEIEKLEAETRLKEAEAENRLRLQQEYEEQKRIEKRKQEVEAGLSFLQNTKDFDSSKGRIDQWMKKAGVSQVPNEQLNYVYEALMRFFSELKPKEQKKWQEPFAKNPIWKKIASWVGPETAAKWFNEIIQ